MNHYRYEIEARDNSNLYEIDCHVMGESKARLTLPETYDTFARALIAKQFLTDYASNSLDMAHYKNFIRDGMKEIAK